ncbi:PAS domain S-box-containing protein [Breoghania corrubedonensis]|uniref:histidine kinase n=1 Tax=Breoghania corrubedonensis TaxID=665038 RepID=A0A2T5V6R7_9HYPH|nr:PAS domain S-box protein [Breoghania corrubedonensis]PTW59453.1 PAS domain S-box-containing protein [Breoghania corrubedonensis]
MDHDRNGPFPHDDASHLDSLEDLPLPAALMAADGLLLDVNIPYCEAFGLNRAQVMGTSVYDRVDKELGKDIRRGFAALKPSCAHWTSPALLQTLHGRERRRIWQSTGHFNADGELETVLLVFWDVTEEYRYNETLEELIRVTNDRSLDTDEIIENILRIGYAYFSMSTGTISRYAEEGVYPEIRVHNDFSEKGSLIPHKLAYTSITHSRGNIVAIEDLDKTPHADAPFRKRIPVRSFLSAEIYVDGSLYGALSFASPEAREDRFTNEDIQLIRILAQWLSYTLLRRRKIEELKASEEKYRFIYQNSPIMMHTIDSDLKITDVNRMWLKTLGYTREEAIGQQLFTFFTEADREKMRGIVEGRTSLPLVNAPRTMVRADGTLVEVEASTLSEPEAGPFAGLTVLNNVTDRNRAQRSLARLNEGLRRTNEGLKRFNAIAAHDLQEPLRKIRLFSDVLEESLGDNDDPLVQEPLAVIRRSSSRLSKLVSDLQTYTRETQRSFLRLPIDLNQLLHEVLQTLAPSEGAQVSIDPLPQVTGDPNALNKLFINLLTQTLPEHSAAHPATVRILAEAKADGGARLTIPANGIVLPPGKEERIFEAFAAPQRHAGPDTSLNLAIAKSIVEGHGWEIRAEPASQGTGTDFIIDIPAHQIIRRHLPDQA